MIFIDRVVNGHDQNGYTIISAFRQDLWKLEDGSIVDKEPTQGNYIKLKPGSQLHIDANNIRTNNLRNMIKKEFSYIPVFGRFKTSFIVFPFNLKTKADVPFDYFVSRISQFGRQFNFIKIL